MSTPEDLRLDAAREQMVERHDALHVDDPDDDCPVCIEDAQIRYEDREADRVD